jgi:hypothetical protein
VKFPAPFKGISTSKLSEGNAMLIYRFLDLNGQHLVTLAQEQEDRLPELITNQNASTGRRAGGVFIDMQVS